LAFCCSGFTWTKSYTRGYCKRIQKEK